MPREQLKPWFVAPGVPARRPETGYVPEDFLYVNELPPDDGEFSIARWAAERAKRMGKPKDTSPKYRYRNYNGEPLQDIRVFPSRTQVPVPVPVPMQVPVRIAIPTPVMVLPHLRPIPIVPCRCICCMNGCPGPEAHDYVYQNQMHHHHHHHHLASSSKDKDKPTKKREQLNRILSAKAYLKSNGTDMSLVDVSIDPMTYIYDRYDRKQLDELATHPALQEMKIVHGELPWEITVRSKDSRGVTVRDVLDAIWHELNIPVSEEDASKMRGHWLVMHYRDSTSNAKKTGDRHAGLKRMHWMRLENHNVVGLEPHKTDKWLMVFEKASD